MPRTLREIKGVDTLIRTNPFTDKDFICRMTDDGFVLYSAGWNGVDDGGKHNPDFGRSREKSRWVFVAGDYVFWLIPAESL